MTNRIDRRRFLCVAAASGAGIAAAGLAARRASALTFEQMAEPSRQSYIAACESPGLHRQLLAEIDAKLGGGGLTREQIAAIRTANRCPLCGCPLVEADPAKAEPPAGTVN
jgi:hypothetical protein